MKDRKNAVFIITVIIFLVCLIIAKVSYVKMQEDQMGKLSAVKWYTGDEETVKKLGNLEVEFKNDGTFDIFQADTGISCMSGEYSVLLSGYVKIKSDKVGFNPPNGWKCKRKSIFKYSMEEDKLLLTYKKVTGSFMKKGDTERKVLSEEGVIDLHNKYFINKQAKMLVNFYMGTLYMYNLDDINSVFGTNQEVLGELCLFGEYTQDKAKIIVNAVNEGDVMQNPMWPQMKDLGEYDFLYRITGDCEKIVLQYEDKAYEFERL